MSEIETILDQFDCLWRDSAQPPELVSYLEGKKLSAEQTASVLPELVAIDMEYRWRTAGSTAPEAADTAASMAGDTSPELMTSRPLVEDYVARWPQLAGEKTPIDLVVEEFRIRQRFGDRPDIGTYLKRFGDSAPLRTGLQTVELELSRDQYDDAGTPGSLQSDQANFAAPGNSEAEASELPAIPRYRIVKRLGTGGMGEVFMAEDTKLERRVALKTPHLIDNEALRQRFFNEAKAAATLRHPGICPVFDVGRTRKSAVSDDGLHRRSYSA